MSKQPKVLKPQAMFWIHTGSALAVVAVCVLLFYLTKNTPVHEERSTVRVSDLLSILIAVSGVTVPLSIAYLSIRSRDIQISLADKAAFCLRGFGINIADIRFAYLFLTDRINTGNGPGPSRALAVIIEVIGLRDGDEDQTVFLTPATRAWLLGESEEHSIYQRYFEENDDRDVLVNYIWMVGISSAICFMDLYGRFFGMKGYGVDLFEIVLTSFTFFANITAYLFILKTIRFKDRVKKRASLSIVNACSTITGEVTASVQTAQKLKDTLSERLKIALEAANRSIV
jgi:hypothetical protein